MTDTPNEIHLLEAQLEQAKKQEELADQAWWKAGVHNDEAMGAWDKAARLLAQAEAALASAKGEPNAVTFGFPIQWDMGAPQPIMLASDRVTLLTFWASELYSTGDELSGQTVERIHLPEKMTFPLALVEFKFALSAKLGAPSDEVFHGHYLEGRGLEPYSAQIVRNSPWLRELEQINSVHSLHRPENWKALHHYIFWFHDSTFECIAEDYVVSLHREGFPAMLAWMSQRLLET